MDKKSPKLRTVSKSVAPYPLNTFPSEFPYNVGEQLVYVLATRGATDIEGKEWEQIFARAVAADAWKPSNVGLDDIVLGNTAWGAKSVKEKKPSTKRIVRLISGRNDLQYSFQHTVNPLIDDPNSIGEMVLEIYNERVSKVREHYKHLRTVVLIRSYDLTEAVVFETDTIRYDPELYYWEWNKGKNLQGYVKRSNEHKFTWQSGGNQFTIMEAVPPNNILIKIRKPALVEKDFILQKIGFQKDWISVTQNSGN